LDEITKYIKKSSKTFGFRLLQGYTICAKLGGC
jgi:hypothetical protein